MPELSDFENVLIEVGRLNRAQSRALERGKIVQSRLRAAGIDGAQALVRLSYTPEQIWEVIADYASFPRWMHGVRDIPSVEWTTAETARVAYVMQGPFRDVRYTLIRSHQKPERVRWTRHSGDLAGIWGGYDLMPETAGTLVRYWTFVDPGFRVPAPVRAFFTSRGIEQLLASARNEIVRRHGDM